MKKKLIILLSIIIVMVILVFSIFLLEEKDKSINDLIHDVSAKVAIGKDKLDVTYLKGNMLDESFSYGNVISKKIKIENNNDNSISFAIKLNESEINNSELSYDISYTDELDESETYEYLSKNNKLNSSNILVYNIAIEANESIIIKIDFKANMEQEMTILKGVLSVENNISANELFSQNLYKIQKNLEKKIASLNGISTSGYFIIDVEQLKDDDTKDFKGYVLINATDISSLEYYYTIYNDLYLLNNYKLTTATIKKSNLKEFKKEEVNKINKDSVCKAQTKKQCYDFKVIKYNPLGGKDVFTKNALEAITKIQDEFKYTDKRVYIYSINNKNIHGYILIDNQKENTEYFLYLTNDLYMVSGYNMTKYGMFNENSSTIRAYNSSAFNLAAGSLKKVCEFTGFTECFTSNNEKV